MTTIHAPVIHGDDTSSRPTEYALPPITLWTDGTGQVANVLPGPLELNTFVRAVGHVAGHIRAIGGRYRRRPAKQGSREKYEYYMALVDQPVPIHYVRVPSSVFLPSSLDVIRSDLADFIDVVDVGHQLNNDAVPLFKIKITEDEDNNGRTVVGFSWSHIIGDVASEILFLHLLSTVYTFLVTSPDCSAASVANLLSQTPISTTHLPPFSSPPTSAAVVTYGLPQTDPQPAKVVAELYRQATRGETVTVRLTDAQLRVVKAKASGATPEAWVSTQDALIAWVVEVLRLDEGGAEEIEKVVNVVNYRTLTTPPLHPNLIGNTAQFLSSPIPTSTLSPHTPSSPSSPPSLHPTASSVRRALQALTHSFCPETISSWLSVASHRIGLAADSGPQQPLGFFVYPLPGSKEVVVNSNLRYDWNVSFGYPREKTRHHTVGAGVHYLRVFQPNPAPEIPPGTGAELVFQVRPGRSAAPVQALMEQDKADGWARYA